ncbi:MAG: hypothetical protein A2026_08590 [Deltaproteobacteria bacterium RBG_19FT_COMBO_46_12]|nr:MAG: hypothetical protein A2026_08590 [Deltaproteobacteria bacterium RBG_19FT_COMBO_46_12]
MDENTIIGELEGLIEKIGVQIRHEPIKQDEDSVNVVGGLCLLKGEYVLIINSKAAIRDKIRALGMALKHFDHEKIYMLPVLRELLDRIPEQEQFNLEGKQINVNDSL